MPLTIDQIRTGLIEIINESAPHGNLQSRSLLNAAARRLSIEGNQDLEQVLLTVFGDMFRTGHLAWGLNVTNPDPPFLHLTEQGRQLMQNFSRDPANPDGYIAYLQGTTAINDVAMSYLKEALKTYNADCSRAAAVMIGTSLESIILELRDALVDHLGSAAPKKLKDSKIKTVLDTMNSKLDSLKGSMEYGLRSRYEASWSVLVHQVRSTRNDAGHPTSLSTVTQNDAHASLLVFPEIARLAYNLKEFIEGLR
ncbi:hypothetical protein LCGC14_1717080 [marine sediment metagenome]|uniref:Abortive infection protein-like C-terminal domain-containing protein n=1 Tax=marine sediment metagenome TaxID=412755 RepID=A0A0F9HD96_9ZZZZ